jgi:hypothetical protein
MVSVLVKMAEHDCTWPTSKITPSFRNIDEGWNFLLAYGAQRGFEVRRRYTNKSKIDGKIKGLIK